MKQKIRYGCIFLLVVVMCFGIIRTAFPSLLAYAAGMSTVDRDPEYIRTYKKTMLLNGEEIEVTVNEYKIWPKVESAFDYAYNLQPSETCTGQIKTQTVSNNILDQGNSGTTDMSRINANHNINISHPTYTNEYIWDPVFDKGTPMIWPTGNWEGPVEVTGYDWINVYNSNPDMVDVSVTSDGGELTVMFTQVTDASQNSRFVVNHNYMATNSGTAYISVGVCARYNHYSLGETVMELNFDYTIVQTQGVIQILQ